MKRKVGLYYFYDNVKTPASQLGLYPVKDSGSERYRICNRDGVALALPRQDAVVILHSLATALGKRVN